MQKFLHQMSARLILKIVLQEARHKIKLTVMNYVKINNPEITVDLWNHAESIRIYSCGYKSTYKKRRPSVIFPNKTIN